MEKVLMAGNTAIMEAVRLAICGKSEVLLYGRPDGAIITPEEIQQVIIKNYE